MPPSSENILFKTRSDKSRLQETLVPQSINTLEFGRRSIYAGCAAPPRRTHPVVAGPIPPGRDR